MCEELGRATGVRNQHYYEKYQSELVFLSRSVFVVAVSTILEGERDYGEQTLATPIFQILHFLRGVVNFVLVNVEVQGVKSMCFSERQKSGLYIHQKHIFAQQTKTNMLYSIVL